MIKKKSFVLRIDSAKMESIEKWAEDEFRSTNGQLEWIIDKALRDAGRMRKRNLENNIEPSNNNFEGI
jgi:hypothetical protein